MLIDTHVHICDKAFDTDRCKVIQRASAAGVKRMIAVGENMEDAVRNLELTEKYPELLFAAGLYPLYAEPGAAEEMYEFIRQNKSKLAAIGEVGLDFRTAKDGAEKDLQKKVLEGFAELGLKLDIPLNVHCRSAGRQAVSLLLEKGVKKAQLHAFDGKAGSALPGVEAGYFFSVPPSVVRSRQKQKLVRRLPLSCMLIESDSPVLGPEPGKRNEPANCTIALEAIASLKNISVEQAAEAIHENTECLYGPVA
ncbi:MAG: TatD family hydrolase [Desulfobacteraceae bacterium]|nr:TatD family hydrolase [Desulfobacteraceae bacterium]